MLLSIASVLASLAGLALLPPDTAGVGLLVFGCLLGILARIAQASSQTTHPRDRRTAATSSASFGKLDRRRPLPVPVEAPPQPKAPSWTVSQPGLDDPTVH